MMTASTVSVGCRSASMASAAHHAPGKGHAKVCSLDSDVSRAQEQTDHSQSTCRVCPQQRWTSQGVARGVSPRPCTVKGSSHTLSLHHPLSFYMSLHSQGFLSHMLSLYFSHLQGQREGHSPPQRSHPVLRLAPQREVPEHARSVVLHLLRGLSQQGQQAVEPPEGQQLVPVLLTGQRELLQGLGTRSLHVQRAVGVLQDCEEAWDGACLQCRQGFEDRVLRGALR